MREPDFTATILRAERLKNSANGNPRFTLYLHKEDGGFEALKTQTDSGISFEINNSEFRDVPVNFWVTRAERIWHAEPA